MNARQLPAQAEASISPPCVRCVAHAETARARLQLESWKTCLGACRARRWERMVRLSPSNGLHTLQPQTLELRTVGGLTWSCTEPHRTAARCAATPRLYPRSRGLCTRSHAPLPSTEPRCEWKSDASTPRTRSLRVRGRKSSSSSAQR